VGHTCGRHTPADRVQEEHKHMKEFASREGIWKQ
jgi:hypothetical protein